MGNEEHMLVAGILAQLLDGQEVALDEHLLVTNAHDARLLLHEASIIIAEFAEHMPAGTGMGIMLVADALHRVSCEKTAKAAAEKTGTAQQEEPQTWSSESPFLN